MPEGPEVRTFADWLHQELVGTTLQRIDYNDLSRYAKKTGLEHSTTLNELCPLEIIDIDARGKKILFCLEKKETGALYFLVSSPMMEGKWTWQVGKHSGLWLELTDERKIYFDDARHFGTLEIFLTQELFLDRMGEIGPDLLVDDISDEEWLKKIRNKRLSRKKIGVYLMEQKYFSGIGNYLRAEILYAAKISPHRLLSTLTEFESLLIFHEARRLLRESYEAQGASLATYTSPYGGKGSFRVLVYAQSQDPQGNPVVAEDIGDKRTTHWVPAIQV
jgi:DNA-formamidopyrimidine glycosylase